jgi:hypothetical protein
VTAPTLSATASGGIILNNTSNAISSFNATNSGSGDVSLTTTATPLTITGITQNGSGAVTLSINPAGSGQILLGANISSNGGSISVNNPISLTGSAAISSNNGAITLGSTVNGAQTLTLNAGSSGDITFNGNIGGVTPLQSLIISNAHNITNNGVITLGRFTQNAGSTTAFGNGGITSTGNSSFTSNNVTGSINVASLSLGTNFANLVGTIAGGSGVAAIQTVTFLNSITSGTHFFNGIDMSLAPTPTPTPSPINVSPLPIAELPQTVLPNNITNFYSLLQVPLNESLFIDMHAFMKKWKSCETVDANIEICTD